MSNQHKCGAASSIEKDSLYTKSLALCCCPEKIEHLSCAPGKSVYIVHTHTYIYIYKYKCLYLYIYMYRKKHLSHTIFHTQSLTHHLTHNFVTHRLSHTIFHTPSLTHHLHLSPHHLSHTHNFVTNHFSSTSDRLRHLGPSNSHRLPTN